MIQPLVQAYSLEKQLRLLLNLITGASAAAIAFTALVGEQHQPGATEIPTIRFTFEQILTTKQCNKEQ